MRTLPLALLALLLCACFGRGPSAPEVSHAEAMADPTPRRLRVEKVWNTVEDHVRPKGGESIHISHLIEVEVLEGPDQGRRMTLPYDDWMVSAPPPRRGEVVTAAPRDWVARNPKGTGRPFGGW